MLRLDRRAGPDGSTTLIAQGQLAGEWIALLESSCARESVAQPTGHLRVDLAGLTYADLPARRLLRQLRRRGIVLLHCPPLIEAQLDEEATDDDAE